MKKLFFALVTFFAVSSCAPEYYYDDHVPVGIKDGVFSFEYHGKRYHQYRQFDDCSAHAICHSNLDTIVISGGVAGKPISRVILAIPAHKVSGSGLVRLQDDEIVIMTERDTIEAGKDLTYEQYVRGISASVFFDNFLDATKEEQFVSGTFEIDGPKWRGRDLDMSDGLFKLWVKTVDGQYRDSQRKYLYNVSYFSD